MTAPVFITEADPGSAEWHAARAKGLGGSEIAAVLGLSPFESRFGLWHRKAGLLGQVEETDPMEWGKLLEPLIAQKWLTRTQQDHGLGFALETGMWHAPGRPWQIANPDRLLVTAASEPPVSLLEIKLSLFGDGWGPDGTDEIPPHVRCQVLWYLDVFGLDSAHVVVLIAAGLDIRTYTVEYDYAEAGELRDAARQFLDDVAHGRRPDIDDHAATYEAVRELHPDIDGTEHEVPGDLAARFIHARRALQEATSSEQLVRSELADHIGDAHRAVWDGRTIARRQARNGGIPYLVAARNLPDLHLQPAVDPAATGTWVDPDTGDTF